MEYKATVDQRVIADKLHLSIYADDADGLKALLELRKIINENAESTCVFSDEVESHLAGLFIRII